MTLSTNDCNCLSQSALPGLQDHRTSRFAITACAMLFMALSLSPSSSARADIIISEVMASNDITIEDEDGDDSDWIELHNNGTAAVDLNGWYLTDDDTDLTQWQFPSLTLGAGDYLVIFASNKDRSTTPLHTNFKLSAGGEYLALIRPDGTTLADEIAPEYPQQYTDISWGYESGTGLYYNEPTPGSANSTGFAGVADINVDGGRGFYTSEQNITFTTATQGASIRYTLDGNDPRQPGAQDYSSPLTIDRTTVVRVVAVRDGYISSPVETHTLLFVADVVAQTTMSPTISQDTAYNALMLPSLTALPAISIVTRQVINPDVEVEASLEWLTPDNSDSFQLNAGVRNYGNASLNSHPKNHMRLYFRGRYGASKLDYPLFDGHETGSIAATDSFDQLNLRTGSHDSPFWNGRGFNFERRGSYLRTRWSDDTMLAMGHNTTHGRYVHVYLNGTYWGQHHLRERFNDDFLASYFGGNSDNYEMINEGIPSDGDGSTWETIKSLTNNWQQVKAYLDNEQFVDYMILNLYAGNVWDWWDKHNWRSGGYDGLSDSGWQFFNSDQDITFQDPANNLWDSSQCQLRPTCINGPDSIWANLRAQADPDFKMLFADRIYTHLFNDGLLTPQQVDQTWMARHAQIESSLVAETARWGNGRLLQETTGRLKHVSFGIDGSIWGVNSVNNTYRRRTITSAWERVLGDYTQIDALDYDRAIAVNATDQIFYYNGDDWVQIPGGLRQVSFGIDGSIWGVNAANNTYRRRSVEASSAWQNMGRTYVDIDALDYDRAVALTTAGAVETFDGSTWTPLDGTLADISYAIDGALWGVNAAGTVYRRKRLNRPWQVVAGSAKQVDGLYWDQAMMVNSADIISHYSGVDYDYQRDDEWTVENNRLRQQFFPFRTATVIQQFRDQGWYPSVDPAALTQLANGALAVNNPNNTGTLWYTTDGTDPRLSGGDVASNAVSCAAPCILSFTTETAITVRIRQGDVWSAVERGTVATTPSVVQIADLQVSEDDGQVAIQIFITPPSPVALQIGVHTRAVSASGGTDYFGFSQTVNIPANTSQTSIGLTLIDDVDIETTETLLVRIFDAPGVQTGDDATVTIVDDDTGNSTPSISLNDITLDETATTASASVSLSQVSATDVTLLVYSRADGTATPGEDFYGFTQSITIPAGSVTAPIQVTIIDDLSTESDETFSIRLTDVAGARVNKDSAIVTIADDDALNNTPVLSIGSVTVNEASQQATLTISLSRGVDASVTVFTRNDSAAGGTDYYGFTRTVTFTGGSTQEQVVLTVLDDTLAEVTESLTVRLVTASGARIANGVATVTIEDDD